MRKVKSKEALGEYFNDIDVTISASGDWEHPTWSTCFTEEMWNYCGKRESVGHQWLDEWLEPEGGEYVLGCTDIPLSGWTDKHYNFLYKLTEQEKASGEIKVDPYWVALQWGLGAKDSSGILTHQLKTIARFGDKNPIEREITALEAQIKRLKELYVKGEE